MYTNILIPTDGSALAGKAVQHGIALAKRISAKVTVLTVPAFSYAHNRHTDDRGHAGTTKHACTSMPRKRLGAASAAQAANVYPRQLNRG